MYFYPVKHVELKYAIVQLDIGKAVGLDEIYSEFLCWTKYYKLAWNFEHWIAFKVTQIFAVKKSAYILIHMKV